MDKPGQSDHVRASADYLRRLSEPFSPVLTARQKEALSAVLRYVDRYKGH